MKSYETKNFKPLSSRAREFILHVNKEPCDDRSKNDFTEVSTCDEAKLKS